MTPELNSLARSGVVILSTYLLHSFVVLGATWLVLVASRTNSWTLRERVWRWMAVLPFVTASVQLAWVDHSPLVAWTFDESSSVDRRIARSAEKNVVSQNGPNSRTSVSEPDDWSITIVPAPVSETVGGLEAVRPHATKAEMINAGVNKDVGDSRKTSPSARSHSRYAPSLPLHRSVAGPNRPIASVEERVERENSSSTDTVRILESRRVVERLETEVESVAAGSSPVVADVAVRGLNEKSVDTNQSSATDVSRSTNIGVFVAYVVSAIALAWIILGAFSFVLAFVRHRRWCRLAAELHVGIARQIVDSISQRHGIRRPIRLLSVGESTDPAAFGFWRWTIVLPIGIEGRLDSDQLLAVLTHEVAHLVRGDTRWLFVGRLLRRCFGWQPLNLLAVREWRRASECLSDDWAVERGVTGIELAKCLTQLAEWRLDSAPCSTGLAAVGSKNSLRMRVERLLTAKPARDLWQRRWSGFALAIALLGISWLLIQNGPRTAWARESTKPSARSESDQLDGKDRIAPSTTATKTSGTNPESRSDRSTKPAAKSPLNIAKPVVTDSANPVGPSRDSLHGDIAELVRELNRAMQMMRADDDPEVKQVVDQIRLRLRAIRHTQYDQNVP